MEPLTFGKAIEAITSIRKTAQSLSNAREELKVNEVAIHLQGIALDLQSEMMMIQTQYQDALRTCEDLKSKLVQYENWDNEKSRYRLEPIGNNSFVFSLKPDHPAGEQEHWLCTNCYNQGQKSILQMEPSGYTRMCCPRCQMKIQPAKWPKWA